MIGAIAMHSRLHKNARTTPAIRTEIAASNDSVATLAARYHVGQGTIRRWRTRSVFTDGSHTAHRLQTTLNSAQEMIVV
ncbi:MAG: IS481 family transposase, partial [Burkholderiaceae bacterium]|nr:IS481 family transposase [Burkholderiaceae bacterium]